VIYSNEVLQLTENSNALTGRMIVLRMTKSFYGKEDTDLSAKLMAELSGIFNWSMEGLRRRVARGGQFVQPKSGLELLETMEEISNPIGTFFTDTMEIDPNGSVDKDDVFAVFKKWALDKGVHPGTGLAFKRKFLAAVQDKPIRADRVMDNGERQSVYHGVRFKQKALSYLASLGDYKEDLF
jgi:putative DNA primase/helicase